MDKWTKLKHFSQTENWGDPAKMDEELLFRLDDWRGFIGKPVSITSGTQGEHTADSQHYLGRAVDVIVPTFNGNLLDLYFSAERFGFRGIGLYPHWRFGGRQVGGLHLDSRRLALDAARQQARWLCRLENGKQVYEPLNLENLKKLGVV